MRAVRKRKRLSGLDPVKDWDGRALIFLPNTGKVVDADDNKRDYAEPVMNLFDSLPAEWRALLNDFGDIKLVKFYQAGYSVAGLRQMLADQLGAVPI